MAVDSEDSLQRIYSLHFHRPAMILNYTHNAWDSS